MCLSEMMLTNDKWVDLHIQAACHAFHVNVRVVCDAKKSCHCNAGYGATMLKAAPSSIALALRPHLHRGIPSCRALFCVVGRQLASRCSARPGPARGRSPVANLVACITRPCSPAAFIRVSARRREKKLCQHGYASSGHLAMASPCAHVFWSEEVDECMCSRRSAGVLVAATPCPQIS